MKKQYHILNGDALKEQFSKSIQGEIIVARECLVDGSVEGENLTEFFKTRAEFISRNYDGFAEQDYFENTVSEFQKIQNIPAGADINLWFEDDLFCQVNFWFVLNLLSQSHRKNKLFLVRPKQHRPYSFAGLKPSELISVYENRVELTELDKLAKLWAFYQANDTEKLVETSKQLEEPFPFIHAAVMAHIERLPNDGNLGRPSQTLIQIMNELNTVEFQPLFKAFCEREAIYGFGDLQVKRLLYEIKKSR